VSKASIGGTLRATRLRLGWTQAQAGALVGYSASAISRIERGRAVDMDTLRRLADCYGIAPDQLGLTNVTDQPGTSDENGDDVLRRQFLTTSLTVPTWMLTMLDDALAILPEPSTQPLASSVEAKLTAGHRLFGTGNHIQLIAGLPDLLAAAHHLAAAGNPADYDRVAACYDLATHTLNKIGRHYASRLTADRAMLYAHLSGSPLTVALSSRALSIVLRHERRPHIAQRVNLAAINDVEATGLTTPAQRAVFIQMLCSAAYAAAHSGDRDRALGLAAEADHALRGLPERPAHPATPVNATALTKAQVRLYKVGMYWALGDSAAALDSARGLHPAQFPTPERRGRLFTDMARAWWQHGRPDQTAHALLAAHRHAPTEITNRPTIRKIASDLADRHPRTTGTRELRTILAP
jgi:transcriptional regulator with XRE-family HTH domain